VDPPAVHHSPFQGSQCWSTSGAGLPNSLKGRPQRLSKPTSFFFGKIEQLKWFKIKIVFFLIVVQVFHSGKLEIN
jgi:hypothetical protein